jgi:hypothetical protein
MGRRLTAQGHPRAIFKWAIEHGNVTVEMTACELGLAYGKKKGASRRLSLLSGASWD